MVRPRTIRNAAEIWRQPYVPVLYLPAHGDLLVKTPYADDMYAWLRDDNLHKPKWTPQFKCWSVPRCWFEELIRRLLKRFGWLYLIQPYREHEVCAPACWNAKGHVCVCSCLGANHGCYAGEGWRIIDDTFAIRWGPRMLGCRLLRRGDTPFRPTVRQEYAYQ